VKGVAGAWPAEVAYQWSLAHNSGALKGSIKQFNYGAFCSTGSQTNPVADVSRSMQLDTTEHSVGVSVVAGSRITFAHAGVYNIQFSAQLESIAAGSNTVNIWLSDKLKMNVKSQIRRLD
jgi:hypothetical protein